MIQKNNMAGGFAAQNSATMLIGIGLSDEATVTIHWPSGTVTGPQTLAAGTLALCHEAAERENFELSPYHMAR